MTSPQPVELREAADGSLVLAGHASVIERPYEMPGYTERVQRGAFKRTLSENPDVALLLNHEGLPLARTTAGTLRLAEDAVGLAVEANLNPADPDTAAAVGKLRRGDLDEQMSMAFSATGRSWSEDYTERTILSVSLHKGDVSLVTQGANPATSATLRADALTLEQRRERAAVIGKRVTGPVLLRDRETGCARCGGTGAIELLCPNCSRPEGPLDGSTLSTSTGGGSGEGLAQAKMDLAAMRLGIRASRRRSRSGLDPFTSARVDVARWRRR
jgi:HK97 family phage prohead protease